jgi:ADP-heptose:LPS heptosyltransferase
MSDVQIIISRTDNIGDVVLSLPLAGFLKRQMPAAKLYFIGKSYTRPVIESSQYIDQFLDRETVLQNPSVLTNIGADAIIYIFPDKEVARAGKNAGIPVRVGTSHRFFHWLNCNKLVNLSRKNSDLHEAQLNFKLLHPLGIEYVPELADIPALYGMQAKQLPLPEEIESRLHKEKFILILHPKSKGSAREWPMENYLALARQLSPEEYQIFVTGTEAEGALIKKQQPDIFSLPHVSDATGKLSLEQLIKLIGRTDGLIACSTGPLHIAAALGKHALGIYPPIRPMHPGRWAPLGTKAEVLVLEKNCEDCRRSQACHCIRLFASETLHARIRHWTR